MPAAPLPPGSTGLPLLGETLAFAADGFRFVEERAARHGPVFRTSILGRKTAVITSPDASSAWIDPEKISREGSMPPNVQELFAGRSLPLLDGSVHRARKQQVMAGFTREALAEYLGPLEELILASLARWRGSPGVAAVAEFKRLAIEGICRNVLSLEPGAATDQLRNDYGLVADGFSALPIPIPGSTFRRALGARDRILLVLGDLVRERRARPTGDALSRILQARAEDGSAIGDHEAVLELHHVVVAGYIIYAELVAVLLHLEQSRAERERLRSEVSAVAPSGPIGHLALARMPHLLRVVMETKRLCPILPAVFGRARQSFEFKGYTIPAGWMVLWGWRTIHLDPGIYSEPKRFDPGRFSPERAEDQKHEHALSPHGPGQATGHRCPGMDYATLFMQLFIAHLVRDHEWEVPPQQLEYVWNKTPPEPRDGLRIRLKPRS